MSAAVSEAVAADTAFKIASDLHAAYERLIYGLPKYLDAENLTDEENMIREAHITLDVTAHRLTALQEGSGALPASPSVPIQREGASALESPADIVRRWASWINDVSEDMEEPEWGGKTANDVIWERDRVLAALAAPQAGMEARQSRNETQPSRSDILELIRAFDFRAHYGEAEYERLADDLEALAQPNQPRDREKG